MVAIALLGGIIIVISTLMVNTSKTNIANEANLKLTEFMQDIQLKLSQKDVCNYNFKGESSTQNNASPLINLDNSTLIQKNDKIENFFTVGDISLIKLNSTRAELSINFIRTSINSNVPQQFIRKLKLQLVHEKDNTTIKNCIVSIDEDVGDLMRVICNGEGTIISEEGTPNDTSDDICIHAGYSMERCPEGEFVKRFELVSMKDGEGVLRPYFRPVCQTISIPKSLSCAPNELLYGYSVLTGLKCRPLVNDDIKKYFTGSYSNCTANKKYEIKLSGENININCGEDIFTPTPTPTTTPTPTGSPTGNCINLNTETFTAVVPLVSASLDPLSPGRKIKLTIYGSSRGNNLNFSCIFQTNGVSHDWYFTNNSGNEWPGATYSKMYSTTSMNYIYVRRQNTIGNNFSFECGVMTAIPETLGPAICHSSYPGGAECGFASNGSSVNTELENVTPLTICVDDSESAIPMYNPNDPFDSY